MDTLFDMRRIDLAGIDRTAERLHLINRGESKQNIFMGLLEGRCDYLLRTGKLFRNEAG